VFDGTGERLSSGKEGELDSEELGGVEVSVVIAERWSGGVVDARRKIRKRRSRRQRTRVRRR
jgi:hypothetical protein